MLCGVSGRSLVGGDGALRRGGRSQRRQLAAIKRQCGRGAGGDRRARAEGARVSDIGRVEEGGGWGQCAVCLRPRRSADGLLLARHHQSC